jgi:hypothetical protein
VTKPQPLTAEERYLALAYSVGISGVPIHPDQYAAIQAKRDELGSDRALTEHITALIIQDAEYQQTRPHRWPTVCLCHENECLDSRCGVCRLVDTLEEPPPCTTDPELLISWGEEFVSGEPLDTAPGARSGAALRRGRRAAPLAADAVAGGRVRRGLRAGGDRPAGVSTVVGSSG